MVALPFPPMPIMCLKGENNEDSSMSSHDLMARIIACSCMNKIVDEEDHNGKMEIKKNAMQDLKRGLEIACKPYFQHTTSLEDITEDAAEAIYYTFQKAYRDYLLCYNASKDLRFYPISYVCNDDYILSQSRNHMLSRLDSMMKCDEIDMDYEKTMKSYVQHASYKRMLLAYAYDFIQEN